MRALIMLLLALQATPAASVQPQAPEASAAPAEPWNGTLAEGIEAVRARAEAGELEAALALSERVLAPNEFVRFRRDLAERSAEWSELAFRPLEPLLDGLGLGGWPDPALGEVHYARGLVRDLEANAEQAIAEFERAAALAQPGALRLDALYDAGATMVAVAEALFAQIPEVGGAPQAPPAPPGSPGPGGAEADAPDPLDLAEAAFLAAKDKLVVRLRADWRDEDTRANLEWIQRRLAEIEELRRQREEQQQEQPEPDPNGEPSEDSEDQEQQDQEQQDQEQQDQEQQDQQQQDQQQQDQQQQDQQQQDPEPETPEDAPAEDEPTEAEAPRPGPEESDQEQQASAADEPEEPAERLLTREEVMRLLDLLQQIEEEGERVRAQARTQGRQKVEKDW